MRLGDVPIAGVALAAVFGCLSVAAPAAQPGRGPAAGGDPFGKLTQGENPDPIHLVRPPAAPLSAMAQLGQAIFHDSTLSASGRQSCASCHDPANHYGPPGDLPGHPPVLPGGLSLHAETDRAVPSLGYLERQAGFSIGPERDEDEPGGKAPVVTPGGGAAVSIGRPGGNRTGSPSGSVIKRSVKIATDTTRSAFELVPQGGLFWDGRVDTLQQQALQPLLNPVEMANADAAAVAGKLRRAAYAPGFAQLFGPGIFGDNAMLLSEAMFAVARYQIEDVSFHPYTSKFDFWLEGRARLSPAERRGYRLFNDPAGANCGGCHLDQAGQDGQPPRFTDSQFEALGAPRNPALANTSDPGFFDLGLCGPFRADLRAQTQYCGMFLTPTLRNAATRHSFFHNGVFGSLQAVLDFYNNRDVAPAKVYPRDRHGRVAKFNDLPSRDRANVDAIDPPLDRHPGDAPAMSPADEADIIAFLQTLTDGYRPTGR